MHYKSIIEKTGYLIVVGVEVVQKQDGVTYSLKIKLF